jgi:ABC-2 type transport system permease protein
MISSIIFIIIGIGIRAIGVPPTSEEILRIFIFIIICIIYGAFWMSLSMLFSVITKNIVGSILIAIPIWLFFVFFWGMIAKAIADAVIPIGDQATNAQIIGNSNLFLNLQRISPQFLFLESAVILINPSLGYLLIRGVTTNSLADMQSGRMLFNPIPIGQSMIQIWPQLITIISLAFICFAISYIIFMKQEIRST